MTCQYTWSSVSNNTVNYICKALIEYSKSLDLTKANDLRKFKFVNAIILILNGWTRFLHFGYIVIEIIITWYNDKAYTFLATAGLPIVAFTFFNAFVSVIPSWQRFKKFYDKSVEYESLPADASDTRRRQSVAQLEMVAQEMLFEGSLDMNDRVQLFFESLEGRKIADRRQTMPARKINWRSARMMRGLSMPYMPSNKED